MERMLKTMILIIHFTYSYRFPFPFHLLSDNYFHFIFQYLWHSTYRFLSILLNLFGPKFCEKSLNCSLSVVCLFCFVYHSFCYFIWANCWLKSSQGLFSRLSHVYLFLEQLHLCFITIGFIGLQQLDLQYQDQNLPEKFVNITPLSHVILGFVNVINHINLHMLCHPYISGINPN